MTALFEDFYRSSNGESALFLVILAFAGCTATNAPAPQGRPYVMPFGNDGGGGGGGSGGGGMGM